MKTITKPWRLVRSALSSRTESHIKLRSLILYFAISFGICWGCVALLILLPDHIESIFGELSASNPLFMLAVYSPAIAAFFLVIKQAGFGGFKCYFSRLLLWRVHWGWYALIIVGISALFYAGAALKGNLISEPFPFSSWGDYAPVLLFMLFLGPMEEFGWRGFSSTSFATTLYPGLGRFNTGCHLGYMAFARVLSQWNAPGQLAFPAIFCWFNRTFNNG